jgi:hypothetical protein
MGIKLGNITVNGDFVISGVTTGKAGTTIENLTIGGKDGGAAHIDHLELGPGESLNLDQAAIDALARNGGRISSGQSLSAALDAARPELKAARERVTRDVDMTGLAQVKAELGTSASDELGIWLRLAEKKPKERVQALLNQVRVEHPDKLDTITARLGVVDGFPIAKDLLDKAVPTWTDPLDRASVSLAWYAFEREPDSKSGDLLKKIDRRDRSLAETVAFLIGGDIEQVRTLARLGV